MNVKNLVAIALGTIITTCGSAQDIPLFSQKLTNSFIYNPAVAGHTFGSMTYSYKQNYKVEGAPVNHFLSVHTPIAQHRIGIGASVYQEDVTFLRSMYASAAFAYHIPITQLTTLSFGVSAESNSFSVNGKLNFDYTPGTDSDFDAYSKGITDYDFSFGTHFQNRFIKAGISMNRLSTAWLEDSETNVLSEYYTSFVQGLIPLRAGEDMLEPYVSYRKLSDINSILDVGLFYSFDDKLIFGVSTRNANIISGTLGFRLSKHLMVGYSREAITGSMGGFIGAANEFSVRFDFNENNYKKRFSANYRSSVSYRRKTMSNASKVGNRNPRQAQKMQRKLAPYSPNSRYQDIKKLSVKKTGNNKKRGPKSMSRKRKRQHYNRKRRHRF